MVLRKNHPQHVDEMDENSSNDDERSSSPPPPTIPMLSPSILNSEPIDENDRSISIEIDVQSDENDSLPAAARARHFRRNSISLPNRLHNVDDLDKITAMPSSDKLTVTDSESFVCSGIDSASSVIIDDADDDDSNSDDEEKPPPKIYARTPLRTKRRHSVAPLPSLRLRGGEMLANDVDGQSMLSNQNSITSVNSLASLLKEKMQIFPSMMRRKKKVTSDFKIKAFVAFLFLIIVFLVGYAYVMYNQKVLAKLYFDSIKFDKTTRTIKIYNQFGREKIAGRIGENILSDRPFSCLNYDGSDGSVCLEWDGMARLKISAEQRELVNCFTFKWEALDNTIFPLDCYNFAEENGHWYGGGISRDKEWPFNLATFDYAPFVTGDAKNQEFGNALRRYFVSSAGVAIEIDDRSPLYISMNRNNNSQFCMKAMNDEFAFVNRLTKVPELKYRICMSNDIKVLHQQLSQQSLWDGLRESDIRTVHSILEEPVWQIPASSTDELTEATIYNYTENVIALGFLRLGHVLINEFWQKKIGDFSLDTDRFKTLEETVNILHRRGFKIVFTIQPFISTDSQNFEDAVLKKILIYERLSERSIPALTRYKSTASSGVLDITNNASIPWLLQKLDRVVKNYQIDSFFVDFGSAYNMPHYYQCNQSLLNPDHYKTIFTSSLDNSINIIGISGAVSIPKPPAFLSLPPVNSSWDGLQSIIPTVLSYGIIGFPFILPGPVGGDYSIPENYNKMLSYSSLKQPPLVEQELYIRWLQLATFLPSIRFSHLPSEYKSEFVTEVVKELTAIRQKQVIPILKKYLSDAMNEGLPLIRPLWMLDIQDAACLYVNDEFSIGEELIVAPILQQGQTKREVYLPHGVWKDGVDGSLRKGSRWIHNYRVPLEKVAYFVKMPDNTRF